MAEKGWDTAALLRACATNEIQSAQIQTLLTYSKHVVSAAKDDVDFTDSLITFRFKDGLAKTVESTACICAALCMRNSLNLAAAQHLVAASISPFLFQQGKWRAYLDGLEKRPPLVRIPAMIHVLKKLAFSLWHDALTLLPLWQLPNAQQHQLLRATHLTILPIISWRLSRLLNPSKGSRSLSWGQAVRKVMQSLPAEFWEPLSTVLSGPGIVPRHTIIKDTEGHRLLCLGHTDENLMGCEVNSKLEPMGKATPIQLANIKSVLPPYPQGLLTRIKPILLTQLPEYEALASRRLFNDSFRVDKPPPTLLQISAATKVQEVDIAKVADLISSEPVFFEHLIAAASESNRLKIKVTDTKQAIMTYGYERAKMLVTERALTSRLTQHTFPLMRTIGEFMHLRNAFVTALLSPLHSDLVSHARIASTFSSSSLFTLSDIKLATTWQPQGSQWQDIRALWSGPRAQALVDNAIALAKAWKQDAAVITAIQNASLPVQSQPKHRLARRLSLALGASLVLARRCFFNVSALPADVEVSLLQTLAELGHHGERAVDNLIRAAASQSQPSCPYPEKL